MAVIALNGQKKGKFSAGIFPSGLYCSPNLMDQRKRIFSFTMLSNMSQSIFESVQWKRKRAHFMETIPIFISFKSLFKVIMCINRHGHEPCECWYRELNNEIFAPFLFGS